MAPIALGLICTALGVAGAGFGLSLLLLPLYITGLQVGGGDTFVLLVVGVGPLVLALSIFVVVSGWKLMQRRAWARRNLEAVAWLIAAGSIGWLGWHSAHFWPLSRIKVIHDAFWVLAAVTVPAALCIVALRSRALRGALGDRGSEDCAHLGGRVR